MTGRGPPFPVLAPPQLPGAPSFRPAPQRQVFVVGGLGERVGITTARTENSRYAIAENYARKAHNSFSDPQTPSRLRRSPVSAKPKGPEPGNPKLASRQSSACQAAMYRLTPGNISLATRQSATCRRQLIPCRIARHMARLSPNLLTH